MKIDWKFGESPTRIKTSVYSQQIGGIIDTDKEIQVGLLKMAQKK